MFLHSSASPPEHARRSDFSPPPPAPTCRRARNSFPVRPPACGRLPALHFAALPTMPACLSAGWPCPYSAGPPPVFETILFPFACCCCAWHPPPTAPREPHLTGSLFLPTTVCDIPAISLKRPYLSPAQLFCSCRQRAPALPPIEAQGCPAIHFIRCRFFVALPIMLPDP